MSLAAHLQDIKQRKSVWVTYLRNYRWNHPNRLGGIDLTGTLQYLIDEREFTTPGTSAKTYAFALNFAEADQYRRNLEPRTPWSGSASSAIPSGTPAAGRFVMAHRPLNAMWEALSNITATANATVGSCTETAWTRATTGDSWVQGSSTTTDIDFRFTLFISLGGEPDSGGKGDGSDDEKIGVEFIPSYSGTNTLKLPNLATGSPGILRLPWEDSWPPESAYFASTFATHLSTQNAADGGGHSGTCSLTLHFWNMNAPSADFSDSVNSQLLPLI